jgi:L-lactate dehydrogenase complex protein LldG
MHTVDVREELAAQFAARATQLGAHVLHLPRRDLVDAVKTLTADIAGDTIGVTEDLIRLLPEIAELVRPDVDWPDVVFGRARFGIAAAGTVAIQETNPHDRLMTLLAVHHIVLLAGADLVPTQTDAAPILRGLQSSASRTYITLVTGPSRTSDIERVLTIGVHGPSRLTVVLVGDWSVPID